VLQYSNPDSAGYRWYGSVVVILERAVCVGGYAVMIAARFVGNVTHRQGSVDACNPVTKWYHVLNNIE
jgi:hypothetical protein